MCVSNGKHQQSSLLLPPTSILQYLSLPPLSPDLRPPAHQTSLNPHSSSSFQAAQFTMDVPSSTPRRLPPRGPPQQHPTPKHIADIFPPTQPAPLHTRGKSTSNESWDPQPTAQEFTAGTPGSSSNLSEMFDRTLQLAQGTPTRPQTAPSKRQQGLQAIHEDENSGGTGDTSIVKLEDNPPAAPRRYNKENAPPKGEQTPGRGGNTGGLQRSHAQRSGRTYDPFRDMTLDEIEKLSKPQVKRLKDVAHLCKISP